MIYIFKISFKKSKKWKVFIFLSKNKYTKVNYNSKVKLFFDYKIYFFDLKNIIFSKDYNLNE